jgi:hypothetical protein
VAGGAEQVPPVASHVAEHGDATVRLVARLAEELDPVVEHPTAGRVEVVDVEEEADAPGELPADHARLLVPVGAGQEQPGLRSRRTHHDPAFRPTVVGRREGVLDQCEAERVDEEPDRLVVVVDHDGGQSELHQPGKNSASTNAATPTAAVP